MAIALVTNTLARSADASAVTTGSIDTSTATLLVVTVHIYGALAAIASGDVTDSKSNTWGALTEYASGGANIFKSRLFYAWNPSVGSGHTFTADIGAASYPAITVQAFSGVDTAADPLDKQDGAWADPTNTQAPGSVTPTTNNQVVVTAEIITPTSRTLSIDGGFTITDQAPNNGTTAEGAGAAYLVQTTAAAVNPTWTLSGAADAMIAVIATFKAPAAGGGGNPYYAYAQQREQTVLERLTRSWTRPAGERRIWAPAYTFQKAA